MRLIRDGFLVVAIEVTYDQASSVRAARQRLGEDRENQRKSRRSCMVGLQMRFALI